MKIMKLRYSIAVILFASAPLIPVAVAEDGSEVVSQVTGPEEAKLGAYKNHEGHPTRKYRATLDTGPTRFALQQWVDVHPSHKPHVLPLEGMIGLHAPSGANWYANGFLNIHLDGEPVGNVPIHAVRAPEEGRRGAVEFEWRRTEGAWRVRFLALPQGQCLFCSVRYFPGGEPANWHVRLVAYPGRAVRDGEREVATARATYREGAKETTEPKQEWWLAVYDNVYDAGHGRSAGGCAMVYAPEDVQSAELTVSSYPVTIRLTPNGRQLRIVFWDSFSGKTNAQIVQYLKENAERHLHSLGQMRFVNRAVFTDAWKKRDEEISALLAKLGNPQEQTQKARQIRDTIVRLTERLRESPDEAGPDDEPELLEHLTRQKNLLWDLRWEELFAVED